jgi:hypothetical protein
VLGRRLAPEHAGAHRLRRRAGQLLRAPGGPRPATSATTAAPVTNLCSGQTVARNCKVGNYCKNGEVRRLRDLRRLRRHRGAGVACSDTANPAWPKGDGTNLACPARPPRPTPAPPASAGPAAATSSCRPMRRPRRARRLQRTMVSTCAAPQILLRERCCTPPAASAARRGRSAAASPPAARAPAAPRDDHRRQELRPQRLQHGHPPVRVHPRTMGDCGTRSVPTVPGAVRGRLRRLLLLPGLTEARPT